MRVRLLMVAMVLAAAGCAASTSSSGDGGPCASLADEVVKTIAVFTAAMDSEYSTMSEVAEIPTDPAPTAVKEFKAEMQRLEQRRREEPCDPGEFADLLRDRAHRIQGSGYFATTYRAGVEAGFPAPQPEVTQQRLPHPSHMEILLPLSRFPGPKICGTMLCRFSSLSF